MKNKIFISHSSKDLPYVEAFVEQILKLGLDIEQERIFCSSMPGYGIRGGHYMPDYIKKEIHQSSLALLFISKNYKESEICLNEVGAAWATLEKENVIPLLLPEVNFSELGFLHLNVLGLKIYEKGEIVKLIQDCKLQFNSDFNIEKLYKKVDDYLNIIKLIGKDIYNDSTAIPSMTWDEYTDCFAHNLEPFDNILRKAIPAHDDGVHRIMSDKIQNQVLNELSRARFLKHLWFKHSRGDFYVQQLIRLSSGNWLMSTFNWELKISDMWLSMNTELQYEFILIKSEGQQPYKIDSDVGGESYDVGIIKDGTIVSRNERSNGYAVIHGEIINLTENDVEPRMRYAESKWIFLVSDYHKLGYNADETIAFCKKLDRGEVEINEENIMNFLYSLENNPVVMRYR